MFNNQDDDSRQAPRGAKKSNDAQEGFGRRQQKSISLRKDKRNEMLEKKRRQGGENEEEANLTGQELNPLAYTATSNPHTIPLQLLPQFAEMVNSDDPDTLFHGTLMIRKLLSVENNPPIDDVINSGVCPRFVEFMNRDDMLQLQFESAWALTNIASGTEEHTMFIINSGAVPLFIRLLSSASEDCREQATWAVGNLAGEGANCRDYVLSLNVMTPLLTLITSPCDKITVLRNAVWALSNLCRSKPQPKLEDVSMSLPVLASLLNHHDDEVVVDATWALSYISDGANDRVQAVLEAGVLTRIVQLLNAPTTAMITPAIRTIGNVVTGNDRQTQMVINSGAMAAMHLLLCHAKRAIRKETCWTLSNITAGNKDQIQAVISANLFPNLLKCTQAPEFEVKKEAVWAVANTTSGGSPEQLRYLLEINCLPPLCELFKVYDPKIVSVALEAVDNLLLAGDQDQKDRNLDTNVVAEAVIEVGGHAGLEGLLNHSNSDVYTQALGILEAYFDTNEDEAMPGIAPGLTSAQSGFAFDQQGGQEGGGGAQQGGFNF